MYGDDRPAVLGLLGDVVGCADFCEAGFLIERMAEPLPAETMKERFPDTCEALTVQAFFIAFVLGKAPGSAALVEAPVD